MSTNKTVNYNLHSWAATDYVRRIEFNDNFNIIDSTVKNIETVANGKAPAVHVHTDATQTVAGFQSAADKTKLDGVATSANNYTHPSTHAPSIIVQDINNRFVTDTEKTYWNAKASVATATVSVNGLLASTDKAKLDGVENGANNYTHPAAHSPSIITQDISNRFVTDAEKATWNAKAPTTAVTTTVNGLMTYIDKVKLNSVADSANNYVHPTTHPASVIVQDASNRFMTDAERTKLTAIAENANNYVHPLTHPASIITQDASNRFTTDADISKLAGIAAGANNYTHPANHPASVITQDVNNRFATDAEKTAWNAKAPTTAVTTLANGLMIAADKSKLDGVAAGANNYVHPASHAPSVIAQDASNRFVTDAEKTAWNNKPGGSVATTTTDGMMSSTDKTKLDGVETAANNYTHPVNHPASIITQDVSNRFVSDTEKAAWNAKASTAIATTTVDGLLDSADKVKLDGIAASANNYTHPATHPPSVIVQDASNRFMTDAERTKLTGIATGANNYVLPAALAPSIITQDASNRFMTDAERTKLSGVATSANNYVLPSTLPATMITEDTGHKFATDAEKATWNAKASTAVATAAVNGLMPMADKAKLDGFTVVTAPTANSVLKLDANSKLPANITGSADGNAASATKLLTTRAITLTGDVTGTVNFDGSAAVSIATTSKASGVAAGTYGKVTVDTKGSVTAGSALLATDIPSLDYSKITTGKPTTLAGYGIVDAGSSVKVTATLPATAGWYRVATSPLDVGRLAGRFEIDWTLSSVHGQVNINAGLMYGSDPTLNQTMYTTFNPALGLTRARIVHHVTYTGTYAYLEVYNIGANAITITTQLASAMGWSLITPIAGSIPAGYSNRELIFMDGIVTDTQLVSQVLTGIAPLAISSTTVVPNLNADMVDGIHSTSIVQTSRSVLTGAGLTGGGALSADRTISPVWGGTGVATTISRSDHTHTIAGAEVTDVVVTAPTDNEVLAYNTATAKWINQTPAEAGLQVAGSYLASTANAVSATKLLTARSISLAGDVTGTITFDGSANVSITTAIADDSHNHTTANIDGLDTALSLRSLTSHNHTLDSLSNTVITAPSDNELLVWDVTTAKWINANLVEAGILAANGTAMNSSLLDNLDSTQFLRSDTADTGTQLTLTTNLITDAIVGRTSATVVTFGTGTTRVDSTGTATRWKRSDRCYISQEDLGDVSIMVDEGGVSARGFKFEIEPTTYHKSIVFGQCNLKSLESSGQVQVRNITDTGYISIAAAAFTVVSQREMKKNIVPLVINAVDTIDATNLYKYNYKTELDSELPHIGLILDEAPVEVVDPLGTGIDTYAMEALSWKAIQELSAKEKAQAERIDKLEEMVRFLMDK